MGMINQVDRYRFNPVDPDQLQVWTDQCRVQRQEQELPDHRSHRGIFQQSRDLCNNRRLESSPIQKRI